MLLLTKNSILACAPQNDSYNEFLTMLNAGSSFFGMQRWGTQDNSHHDKEHSFCCLNATISQSHGKLCLWRQLH